MTTSSYEETDTGRHGMFVIWRIDPAQMPDLA